MKSSIEMRPSPAAGAGGAEADGVVGLGSDLV
jgi:hypothetical protein